MNNKQAGNEFEREFCEMLSSDGFWAHFMGGSKNGAYTGREIKNLPISFILRDCQEYGLKDGYCILGF